MKKSKGYRVDYVTSRYSKSYQAAIESQGHQYVRTIAEARKVISALKASKDIALIRHSIITCS